MDTISASVAIPLIPVNNILTLEAIPEILFGDGSDSSIVRAILLDTEGHGIPNDTIRFRNVPPDGSIASAVTNANGIAQTVYNGYRGMPGQ